MKKNNFLIIIAIAIVVTAIILRIGQIRSDNNEVDRILKNQDNINLITETNTSSDTSNINISDLNEEDDSLEESKVGGKKDDHGCLLSAGYSWCEPKQKCLRIWEEECQVQNTVDNDNLTEVVVTNPLLGDEISSPMQVEGRAKGSWFFEANLPIYLESNDGDIISSSYVSAKEDWMTNEFVSFTGLISFNTNEESGYLVIKKSNPSNIEEGDKEIKIPVKFK